MTLATLLLVHGDDAHLDLVYFWAAVLIAFTPVVIFGTIGVLVLKKIWKDQRGTRNAEGGTEGPA
ncbi:MAG: hypothetical protein AUI99_05695 [Gemmatimonadetes bacterium 13_1_40CM_3_69_22]|nr:MAG: hypothetical protein AUH12_05910 [Gemmatimonadetes bacterium 13_2_20CM_69_8]OLD02633.1 MAG: hypothetical protein AUI99_05695 [Gemmatimonadetes bacterium 13_1_40CM_3_69_22]OLD74662.1 MAG: hypothetical protein AUG87_15790 [Candidatus Rokubacteria bacterium 13_1_20CM_4_70_14]PYO15725.1 MAG: hypothetical protein DMD31_05565 [Gemmatimonadota bacterium]